MSTKTPPSGDVPNRKQEPRRRDLRKAELERTAATEQEVLAEAWQKDHEKRRDVRKERIPNRWEIDNRWKIDPEGEVKFDGPRPQLFYYRDSEKKRFRARFDRKMKHAMVIRVLKGKLSDAEKSALVVPSMGDKDNGLYILNTGEVLISLEENDGKDVKLEFKVWNPGDGLGDYSC